MIIEANTGRLIQISASFCMTLLQQLRRPTPHIIPSPRPLVAALHCPLSTQNLALSTFSAYTCRGMSSDIPRPIKIPNSRLSFIGQIISLIGSWLTIVATGWLVYRLTGKATWLGIVGFAAQIPMFVLSPFAGVWVDRFSRHKLLLVTQSLS